MKKETHDAFMKQQKENIENQMKKPITLSDFRQMREGEDVWSYEEEHIKEFIKIVSEKARKMETISAENFIYLLRTEAGELE